MQECPMPARPVLAFVLLMQDSNIPIAVNPVMVASASPVGEYVQLVISGHEKPVLVQGSYGDVIEMLQGAF
jgi:hypothetical protein